VYARQCSVRCAWLTQARNSYRLSLYIRLEEMTTNRWCRGDMVHAHMHGLDASGGN
jgi:hypothetical protein